VEIHAKCHEVQKRVSSDKKEIAVDFRVDSKIGIVADGGDQGH
jgi:hypothetical protein